MALAQFVQRVVARVRATPVDLARLPADGARGSIYSGAAGVALFLLEAARLGGDDSLRERAEEWCHAARAWGERATHAEWREMPRGFVVGATGIAYVDARLSAHRDDAGGTRAAVAAIERASDHFDDIRAGLRATEIVGGAAGVACATRDLDARLPAGTAYDESRAVLARVRDRMTAMLLAAHASKLASGPHDLLGVAHGAAGELLALVGVLGADHPVVRARLDELAALRELDEDGLAYWLPARGSTAHDLLGTWCNGMAGHTLLWCEVARQTGRSDARELARLSAESTALLVISNATLCCGLAGHSVALQRYADLTGDALFARRAYDRLARAARLIDAEGDAASLGLWQGAPGVALVALSRLHRETRFPCIEPWASRSR